VCLVHVGWRMCGRWPPFVSILHACVLLRVMRVRACFLSRARVCVWCEDVQAEAKALERARFRFSGVARLFEAFAKVRTICAVLGTLAGRTSRGWGGDGEGGEALHLVRRDQRTVAD
jgi:hypothetical protein